MLRSPLPLPDRLRKGTPVFPTHISEQGWVNPVMADPKAPSLLKHQWQDFVQQDSNWECLPTCLRMERSQEASIQQGATRIRHLTTNRPYCVCANTAAIIFTIYQFISIIQLFLYIFAIIHGSFIVLHIGDLFSLSFYKEVYKIFA